MNAITHRDTTGAPAAVIRVEQLFPWPYDAIEATLDRYAGGERDRVAAGRPENMGPWNFVKGRFYERHETTHSIRRARAGPSPDSAVGSHGAPPGAEDLMARTFEGL